MTPEEKRLRKICRQWEKLYDWERMAKYHGKNASFVNFSKRPKIPERIK